MNDSAKHSLMFLVLVGALLWGSSASAQCVNRAGKPRCLPLMGMRLVGFQVDVPEDGPGLGISRAALRGSTLYAIEKLLPEIRVEENPEWAPQIYVLVSYLGDNHTNAPLHFQVELRDLTTRDGRLVWDPAWLTSYVISSRVENPASEIMESLRESLRRLAEDWRQANPNLSSRNVAPQE